MKYTHFSKTRLAASISMLLGATSLPAYAQEANQEDADSQAYEVINVKGIRGSLARSQDLKRESSGVVDAISAEELGKFPDTNLAESLQRITGVTISRNNNEGSEITVRGFGPQFNLMTLNGRQMPGTGNSRSFALENLASNGVQTLEVYKSSRVDVPSGGLGATVNIVTGKPLSSPGLKFSLSAKGLYDTSNEEGNDVTPELAALYSQTFSDNTFGVSLSASYQERDFQRQEAEVPGWHANQGPFSQATNFIDPRPEASSEEDDLRDGVADGRVGNTYVPRQVAYRVADVQRERTNAHLTLQWAPRDDMTFTLDGLYNESQTATEGFGFGIWFNFGGNVNNYELDNNGTAVRYTEAGGDFAHNRTSETLLVEQRSVGFNWEWQLHDDWHIEFDYHDSSNENDNGGDPGTRANTNVILGPNNIVEKTVDFSSGFPQFDMVFPQGGEALPADFEPLFAQFSRFQGESEVEQFQLHTTWENPNDSFITTVKFGASRTEQTLGGRIAGFPNQGAQQFLGLTEVFPDNLFTRRDVSGLLDEFAGSLNTNYFYDFDISQVLGAFASFFPGFSADPFGATLEQLESDSSGSVTEETDSYYVTADMYFEPFDMVLDVKVGLRHEQTDVISQSVENAPLSIRWFGGAEWRTLIDNTQRTPAFGEGDYDVTLPSIDLKLEVAEDMYVRASWGKTIARVDSLGDLLPNRSVTIRPVPGSRTASFGNPSLEPFESTNFDVTYEWYYKEDSYLSIGYFKKDVENFISRGLVTRTFEDLDLRDPLAGPRAQEAIAQLEAEGTQTTLDNIFDRIIANGGGVTVDGAPAIDQAPSDPEIAFDISQPVNNPDEQTVDGIEVAVSHVFGETGFGVGLNATFVDSDSEFDINLLEAQQPLTGVSDSANAQIFYEKDGLSVKLTYAWRDDYLRGNGQQQASSDSPPTFTRDAGIVDFSINYDVDDNFTVFFEGYNVTNETEENYGRFEEQFLRGAQFDVRYAFGVRYTFN